jgi:heptosyltransferase-2
LLASLSRAAVRIGFFDPWTRPFFTHTVSGLAGAPFVERDLDLTRALGLSGTPNLALSAPASQVDAARSLIEGPAIGLVIGSEWATKRWPAASFSALSDLAADFGYRPVLLGAPSERPIADAVLREVRRSKPLDVVGNTVSESVGILATVSAVVGGDSGLAHAGRALGRPTVLLFGPTDPHAHVLEPNVRALSLGLSCQPCHRHGPRACPLLHHDCLRQLGVERVWNAVQSLLPERR